MFASGFRAVNGWPASLSSIDRVLAAVCVRVGGGLASSASCMLCAADDSAIIVGTIKKEDIRWL